MPPPAPVTIATCLLNLAIVSPFPSGVLRLLRPHAELAERALRVDAGILGQSQHPLADDVAHVLVAAARDAAAGRAQNELAPGVGAPLAGVDDELGPEHVRDEVTE